MERRKLTPDEKKRIAERINLEAGEEAIYTVDNNLTLIISGKHEHVWKKDLERIGKYKPYIEGVYIDDDVSWIEPGTFGGFENISSVDVAERLLANISTREVFSGTSLSMEEIAGMEGIAREYLYGRKREAEKEYEAEIAELG